MLIKLVFILVQLVQFWQQLCAIASIIKREKTMDAYRDGKVTETDLETMTVQHKQLHCLWKLETSRQHRTLPLTDAVCLKLTTHLIAGWHQRRAGGHSETCA
jgi:hypothetical protein